MSRFCHRRTQTKSASPQNYSRTNSCTHTHKTRLKDFYDQPDSSLLHHFYISCSCTQPDSINLHPAILPPAVSDALINTASPASKQFSLQHPASRPHRDSTYIQPPQRSLLRLEKPHLNRKADPILHPVLNDLPPPAVLHFQS